MLSTPIKFIKLAPYPSSIILLLSVVSGLLQSLTILTLVPLSDFLGIPTGQENKFIIIFKSFFNILGIQYSLLSILILMVIFISFVSIINYLS